MRAALGDRIVILGARAGSDDRECEIVELRRANGEPPYRVRWSESGREGVFIPGPDAVIGDDGREKSGRIGAFTWPDHCSWGYR